MLLTILRFTALITIIFVGPVFDNLTKDEGFASVYKLSLRCDEGTAYPMRFLLIFALDVISAIIDLIIFFVSPKIENKRKRLKMARQADILLSTN